MVPWGYSGGGDGTVLWVLMVLWGEERTRSRAPLGSVAAAKQSKPIQSNPSTETQTSGPQSKRNATQERSHNSKYVRLQKSRMPRCRVLWVLARRRILAEAHILTAARRLRRRSRRRSRLAFSLFQLHAHAWRSGAVAHRQRLEPSPNLSDGSALRCVTAATVAFYCVSRSIPSLRVAGSARWQ